MLYRPRRPRRPGARRRRSTTAREPRGHATYCQCRFNRFAIIFFLFSTRLRPWPPSSSFLRSSNFARSSSSSFVMFARSHPASAPSPRTSALPCPSSAPRSSSLSPYGAGMPRSPRRYPAVQHSAPQHFTCLLIQQVLHLRLLDLLRVIVIRSHLRMLTFRRQRPGSIIPVGAPPPSPRQVSPSHLLGPPAPAFARVLPSSPRHHRTSIRSVPLRVVSLPRPCLRSPAPTVASLRPRPRPAVARAQPYIPPACASLRM